VSPLARTAEERAAGGRRFGRGRSAPMTPPRSRTCSASAWPARCERSSPPGSAPPGGRLIVNEHAWDRLDEPPFAGTSSSARRRILAGPARLNDVSTSGRLTTPACTPPRRWHGARPTLRGAVLRLDALTQPRTGRRARRARGASADRGRRDPPTGFRYVGERPAAPSAVDDVRHESPFVGPASQGS
jgi:hypothetical protein